MLSSTMSPSSSITFSRRIAVARDILGQYMAYEAIYQGVTLKSDAPSAEHE